MAKKEEILTAAAALVAREGLGKLSVRAVAAEAGIGATTLRNYFPSQSDLFEALSTRLVIDVFANVDLGPATLPTEERLYRALLHFLPTKETQTGALTGWGELHSLALGTRAIAGVRKLLAAGRSESARTLTKWYSTFSDQGASLTDSPEKLAYRTIAFIDGLHLTLAASPDTTELQDAQDSVFWFCQNAVISGSSPTPSSPRTGVR